MRSLLITTIGIILLGGYLECRTHHTTQAHATHNPAPMKVIREQIAAQVSIELKKTKKIIPASSSHKAVKKIPSLDLTIPAFIAESTISFPTQRRSLNWLKKSSPKKEISYNAELIFDREEGSSIKGAKVNFKIPFG